MIVQRLINRLILLVSLFYMTSCVSMRYKSSDQMSINKGRIHQVSKVAEYTIDTVKISGTYSGMYKRGRHDYFVRLAKEIAVGNALTQNACDILIHPLYDISIYQNTITVTVEGYPATYVSFDTYVGDTLKRNQVVVNPTTPPESIAESDQVAKTKKSMPFGNSSWLVSVGMAQAVGQLNTDLLDVTSALNNNYGGMDNGLHLSVAYYLRTKKSLGLIQPEIGYGLSYNYVTGLNGSFWEPSFNGVNFFSFDVTPGLRFDFGPVYNLHLFGLLSPAYTSMWTYRTPAGWGVSTTPFSVYTDELSFRTGVGIKHQFGRMMLGTTYSTGVINPIVNFGGFSSSYTLPTQRVDITLSYQLTR